MTEESPALVTSFLGINFNSFKEIQTLEMYQWNFEYIYEIIAFQGNNPDDKVCYELKQSLRLRKVKMMIPTYKKRSHIILHKYLVSHL